MRTLAVLILITLAGCESLTGPEPMPNGRYEVTFRNHTVWERGDIPGWASGEKIITFEKSAAGWTVESSSSAYPALGPVMVHQEVDGRHNLHVRSTLRDTDYFFVRFDHETCYRAGARDNMRQQTYDALSCSVRRL